MMNALIVITIINAILLVLNYIIYRMNKKNGVNTKIHSIPLFTDDGDGVVILNKKNKPVVIYKDELK